VPLLPPVLEAGRAGIKNVDTQQLRDEFLKTIPLLQRRRAP
jgi:hypothetical protein